MLDLPPIRRVAGIMANVVIVNGKRDATAQSTDNVVRPEAGGGYGVSGRIRRYFGALPWMETTLPRGLARSTNLGLRGSGRTTSLG